MRRKHQRRAAPRRSGSGHSLFGGTGWLFADLLLALALAFLLATTVGTTPSKPKPAPMASPSRTAAAKAKPKQAPPLELTPVHVVVTIADPAGLAAGTPSAVAALRTAILNQTSRIRKRSAGIVLLFGSNQSAYQTYDQVDTSVETILRGLSNSGPLFHTQTRYVHFLSLGNPAQFSMDVYLFNKNS